MEGKLIAMAGTLGVGGAALTMIVDNADSIVNWVLNNMYSFMDAATKAVESAMQVI